MKKIFIVLSTLLLLTACSEEEVPPIILTDLELPIANFSSDAVSVVEGGSIHFSSTSLNAETLSWTFPGGTPETSNEREPVITYHTEGTYAVTLEASNSGGSDAETKTDYISVESNQVQTATYTVTFTGNWTPFNHPMDFPTGRDHFSSAVGMVHKAGAQIFETGNLASEGIEDMAENGVNGALASEVEDLINSGLALHYFSGGGLGSGDAERSFDIEVRSDYPLVTVVSMIAPSPDWFVAVRDVVLYDNGEFVENLTLEANSYDAGTDSGLSFTSPNADTNPPEPINRITTAPLGNGSEVEPAVASFSFIKNN